MNRLSLILLAIAYTFNLFVVVVAAPTSEEVPSEPLIPETTVSETTDEEQDVFPDEWFVTDDPNYIPLETIPTEPEKTEWEIAVECASPTELGINMKNMYFVTGVTVEELNMLLEGTRLEGSGEYFKRLEDEYGVNAVVVVSVGRLESQLGSTEIALNYNNAFGFRTDKGWLHFNTLEDSVLYFGKLMQHERYYGKSLAEIALIYCPNDIWCDKVSRIVDRHVKMIEEYRGETT